MLFRKLKDLSVSASEGLQRNSEKVAAKAGRRAQYAVAKTIFSAKTPAATFREVRDILGGGSHHGACYYCERDRFRDIDHVLPQSIYPELAFAWLNYVYACTICNQDCKRHGTAIVTASGETIECESYSECDDPLPIGEVGLINPRTEDPLHFISLELGTGLWLPRPHLGIIEHARAEYTIKTLRLNSDVLSRSRRAAFRFYLTTIQSLARAANDNDEEAIDIFKEDVGHFMHPAVLVEMRSQAEFLGDLPEALEAVAQYLPIWAMAAEA